MEVALIENKPTSVKMVKNCIYDLEKKGYKEATTQALSYEDAQIFLDAGFTIREKLHLLTRPISSEDKATNSTNIKNARPWNIKQILNIDTLSFDEFWKFEKTSFLRAKNATPTNKVRTINEANKIIAYSIYGYCKHTGYLQRLAVHPNHQNKGLGKSLVKDSLDWFNKKGARTAMVNTQEINIKAINMYEAESFEKQPQGLLVLRWDKK